MSASNNNITAKPCTRIGVGTDMRIIRSCYRAELIYNRQVRLRSWKTPCFALLTAGAMLVSGCGGISASHTFSPLDFLLPGIGPGLLKTDPPQTDAPLVDY